MRVMSSIIAVVVFASLPLAFLLWQKFDPHFSGRDGIVTPLVLIWASTGAIAASVAIALTTKRRPIAVGFGVYAILHGITCLYFTWRGGFTPGFLDIVVGLSICVGLRAVMKMTRKHENAA